MRMKMAIRIPALLGLLLTYLSCLAAEDTANNNTTLYSEYEKCKADGQLDAGAGRRVCDAEGRLTRAAASQLNDMMADLESNAPCTCADGCADRQYAARLMVTSGEAVEEAGGTVAALNGTAERIWQAEQMGDEKCDNGILLLYIRDRKQMAIYQGHQRFRLYSDRDIANLHEIALRATNRTGTVSALASPGGDAQEVQQQEQTVEESGPVEPIVGLTIALALVFVILMCLLCVLCVRCCSTCCRRRRAKKASKYYVNPTMPTYKSVEPIYIVTPTPSDVPFASPSGASLYGSATLPRHRRAPSSFSPPPPPPPHPMMMFGHHPPPPPPLPQNGGGPFNHHPRSRSTTPASTQRAKRTRAPSAGAGGGIPSMHSTPEAHKRDKVDMQMPRGNGTYHTPSSSHLASSPESASGTVQKHSSQRPSSPSSREFPSVPNQPFPFLDPRRKQEVQTREEFIS